jgi:hypothetical protein
VIVGLIFSNTYWTFWDLMLFFFIWIPLVMLWFYAMIDIFRRPDLSGWGRALWLLAVVFLPWLGTLIYLIFRPRGGAADAYAAGYGSPYGYGYPYGRPPVAD